MGRSKAMAVRPSRVLSRRAATMLILLSVTFGVLFLTSRYHADWSFDSELYREGTSFLSQHIKSRPSNGGFPATSDRPFRPHNDECDDFPDTTGILLVIKTGASEAYRKMPIHFLSTLTCVSDYVVFSDMEQRIGGYAVHDSLDGVLPLVVAESDDFAIYRRQRDCLVDNDWCISMGNPSEEGWALDKYKNIHMAEKVWETSPDRDWYVFVDADTYVDWPNLVRWLRMLDPAEKHYLGSIAYIGDDPFAHGGTGYVLSRAAMEASIGRNPGIGNRYDERIGPECCGDYMFSVAMRESAEIEVEQGWPALNGEKPTTMPYGPSHWCHPVVTMHHMNPEEIGRFDSFARARHGADPARPLLMRDVYAEYMEPRLARERDWWDNLSNDRYYLNRTAEGREWDEETLSMVPPEADLSEVERVAHLSFRHCRAACLGWDECFQFKLEDGVCKVAAAFILGRPVRENPDREAERPQSGWLVARIKKFIDEQGDCRDPFWPLTEGGQ